MSLKQQETQKAGMIPIDPKEFVVKAIVAYVLMGTIGAMLMQFNHQSLQSVLIDPIVGTLRVCYQGASAVLRSQSGTEGVTGWSEVKRSADWLQMVTLGRLFLIGTISGGLLIILSFFFEDWFESFRILKVRMSEIFGRLSVVQVFVVTLVTAFGEELLFRGAIQPIVGLVFASVLFGLIHIGPGGFLNPWSLWAGVAGFFLGWIFNETSSLWSCIVAHFFVNMVSILGIRRQYLKTLSEVPTPGSLAP